MRGKGTMTSPSSPQRPETRPFSLPDKGRVCVAQVGAAHGLKGEVRLRSFTERPGDFAQYGPLQTEDGARSLEIESMREAKDHFIARFRGIADRTAAESLRNLNLYIARDRLPEPADNDTYYHADLIGLSAIDTQGRTFGRIVAVHNFGAGDILEIEQDGKARMFAFDERTVPHVDIAAGQVTIDPPEEIEREAR